jgi:hypothetical protein
MSSDAFTAEMFFQASCEARKIAPAHTGAAGD